MNESNTPQNDFSVGDDETDSVSDAAATSSRLSPEDEQALMAFLLEPVPRKNIPRGVSGVASVGAGFWIALLLGLIFTFMGMVFTWAFFPRGIGSEWKLDHSHVVAPGRVVGVDGTSMYINDARVMEYVFEYVPTGATEAVRGVCYTTGQQWNVGELVSVWYLADDAKVARIEGSRMGEASWGAAFVVIFPLVGLVVLFFAVRSFGRRHWLVRNGLVGEFRVINVVETNVRINNQTRYRAECRRSDDAADEALYCYASHVYKKVECMSELQRTGRVVFGLYDPRDQGAKRRRVELSELWYR